MKKVFLAALCGVALLGAGCANNEPPTKRTTNTAPANVEVVVGEELVDSADLLVADYEPQTSTVESPHDDPLHEGPWNGTFMTATSVDGLNFTKTGEMIAAQLNVPDIIRDNTGRMYLYFTGYTVGDRQDETAVAISEDEGETWVFKYIELTSDTLRVPNKHADPTVVYVEDEGIFRMYTTTLEQGKRAVTLVSESTDGVHFEYLGVAFSDDRYHSIVPSVFRAEDGWHLYSNGYTTDEIIHSVSQDGINFTFKELASFEIDNRPYFAGNTIAVDGGYRMFVYSRTHRNIGSMFSTDGSTWESEGIRLELDESTGYEETFVKDPGVVQLSDGSFLMVYVTNRTPAE